MPLTEQDLTDLEIADSVGDFGRNSKVGDAVEELRELRKRNAELEGEIRVRDDQLEAARQRILAYDERFLAGTRPADSMRFPKHLCLSLRHNSHAGVYEPLETWLENYLGAAEANGTPRDETILPEDLAAIRATGEVWELSWCPNSPVGSCTVVAATLERVLELAAE